MKDFTDITFLLDRSGSMANVYHDVLGGYATFVKKQQEAGDNAAMTLIEFDHLYTPIYTAIPIKDISPNLAFAPDGMTALLDAIGRSIVDTGKRLASMAPENRPDKVIFIVMTDGEDNSSREYTIEKVREMVDHQKSVYNWTFVFMGANMDAFLTGGNMAFAAASTATYATNNGGTGRAFAAAATYTTNLRASINNNDTLDDILKNMDAS